MKRKETIDDLRKKNVATLRAESREIRGDSTLRKHRARILTIIKEKELTKKDVR